MKRFWLIIAVFLTFAAFCAAEKATCILLYDREVVTVNPDGTSTTVDECRYRILNYEGLTRMRELDFHFNSTYGTMKVTHLAIVKPDGRRITLDPAKNSAVNTESSQLASEIFDPAQKVLSVSVPGLEIGDTLEVTSHEQVIKPRLPGEFSDIAVLQTDYPIKYYEYVLNMPASKPLRSICIKNEEKGTITFSRKTSGDRIIYTWIARDVPQVVPESAMPALYTCVQRVLTSTVGSWEEISRWYDKLCEPHLAKVSDGMRKKTAELTAGKKSDLEKIHALFQFVSQQIRYTGITSEESAPGYEPHDVDQTFERRHGVCRDKAALLVAMLRLAGFKAYPVLFMSGTPKDMEVPNIYFNHAIVGVELTPGNYTLMDPTFETTAELLPGYLAGDQYLAAKPEGDTLRTAPPVKAEKNLLEIGTVISAEKLPASIKTVLKFAGIYDQMYRDAFSNWTKDDIRNFFESRVRAILPGAKLKKFTITPANIRDMSIPLSVTLEYSIDELFRDSTVPGLMPMPRGAFVFGLLDSLFTNTALAKRKFPLKALPRAIKEDIAIEFDTRNQQIIMPQSTEISEAGLFRVKSSHKAENDRVSESFFFAIDSMLVAPEDYAKFKAAVTEAKKTLQTRPVISKKSAYSTDRANSEYLKKIRHFDLSDKHNWVEKHSFTKKIFNYAGMKEDSNLTIAYIDGVEKVDVKATVTDANGKKFTLSPKEINRMDAQATAGAPRYRKRKLAVISFPGVSAGSVIDCEVTITRTRQKSFHTAMLTQSDTPVKYEELIIESPAKTALNISPVPAEIQDSATMGGKKIIRRYTAKNSPMRINEPGQPDYDLFTPSLQISTGNYAEYFQEVSRAAAAKAAAASDEVKALAKKIAAAAPDIHPHGMGAEIEAEYGKEKMRQFSIAYALEKYIYNRTREVNLPLFKMLFEEFSLPQDTLRDGYGNSVDRAILLGAMLDSIGIKYEFVPVASTPAIAEKLDLLRRYPRNIFDRLLIRLDQNIYLNDSGRYGIPGIIRSQHNIELDKQGKVTGIFSAESTSGSDTRCEIILADDLSAKVKIVIESSGRKREAVRELFARLTPALQKQYFEKMAAAIAPQAKIVKSAFTQDDEIILELQIPDFARRSGKFVSFRIPEYNRLTRAAAIPGAKRTAPYMITSGEETFISAIVTVPPNYKLCRQKGVTEMILNGVTWTGDFIFLRGKYYFDYHLARTPELLSVREFEQLLDLNREINHINTGNILFTTE